MRQLADHSNEIGGGVRPAAPVVALGASDALDHDRALEEACERARLQLAGRVGTALVALSGSHPSGAAAAADRVGQRLGTEHICVVSTARLEVGASSIARGGLAAADGAPAISAAVVLFSPDVLVTECAVLDWERAGIDAAIAEFAEHLDPTALGTTARDSLIAVFADSHAADGPALCRALEETGLGRGPLVGVACDGSAGAPATLFAGGEAVPGGIVGLRIASPARVGAAHSCRIEAVAGAVTRVQDHWLLAIDGRRALDCLRAEAGGAFGADVDSALRHVLVATERGSERGGATVLRRIVGIDTVRGAIALGTALEQGDRVAFAARDALAARENLKAMLQSVGSRGDDGFALYSTCARRGAALFGDSSLEVGYLESHLASVEILALVGPYQLVSQPSGAVSLLTHTGVLAVT